MSHNPILDHVVKGGRNVTLDLATIGAKLPETRRLFRSQTLNRSIVFKMPNNHLPANANGAAAGVSAMQSFDRPLDTAIYVPDDEGNKGSGGFAIYLRQKDFRELLQRHIGLGMDKASPHAIRDLKVLETLDALPSLDPFLMKAQFEVEGHDIDPAYFTISAADEQNIRQVLAMRLYPIIAKALPGAVDQHSQRRAARFLDAIWDPRLPEASLLLNAFRIEPARAEAVFTGWKGFGFYEYQFTKCKPGLQNFMGWLRSSLSRPRDLFRSQAAIDQLEMHKKKVKAQIGGVLHTVRSHHEAYEAAYKAFLQSDDPRPFRDFLSDAWDRYWDLGFCVNALHHITAAYGRCVENDARNAQGFEQISRLLTIADLATRRGLAEDITACEWMTIEAPLDPRELLRSLEAC
jgi:hypothetical protein